MTEEYAARLKEQYRLADLNEAKANAPTCPECGEPFADGEPGHFLGACERCRFGWSVEEPGQGEP